MAQSLPAVCSTAYGRRVCCSIRLRKSLQMTNRSREARVDSAAFLRLSAIAFAVGFSAHALDHVRRGLYTVPTRVIVIGTIQGVLASIAIGMVLRGHDRAPMAAILIGFGSALLFTNGHLLPISPDSYVSEAHPSVTWFSWVTAFSEITTGIVLGFAGLRARSMSR